MRSARKTVGLSYSTWVSLSAIAKSQDVPLSQVVGAGAAILQALYSLIPEERAKLLFSMGVIKDVPLKLITGD